MSLIIFAAFSLMRKAIFVRFSKDNLIQKCDGCFHCHRKMFKVGGLTKQGRHENPLGGGPEVCSPRTFLIFICT